MKKIRRTTSCWSSGTVPNYGVPYFGQQKGYGFDVMQWVRRNYEPVELIGAEPLQSGAFGIKILKRLPLGNACELNPFSSRSITSTNVLTSSRCAPPHCSLRNFQPRIGRLVAGLRAAQDILPVRGLFRRGFLHVFYGPSHRTWPSVMDCFTTSIICSWVTPAGLEPHAVQNPCRDFPCNRNAILPARCRRILST